MLRKTITAFTTLGLTAALATACGSSGGGSGATNTSTPTGSPSGTTSSSMSGMSSGSMSGSSSGSSAESATATGNKITITTTNDLRFMPSTIIVPKTGALTVTLTNSGSYPHNISVPSLKKTSATVSGTPGEQTQKVTFTFTKAGTYQFVCTYHESAGMVGKFIVKG